ncbi:nicotinamide phosphoribosyltransferase domain-containing protein [Paenibacillus alvei]|uniref:nicotinamide phosphoribosyltransferase domain-containing protein n=1 Tax=Paenibacillus alvei TaxID=44250 RepID=UPI000287F563|nr:nicotinamide phosphoribosyltransferase domain-containing protein [Paenibacillus alvei]EJW13913.1 nicotinic acid phosphoribosyltransferase [Paenibacillus alvei DSM 29]MCY9544705.1 nicotinamide phosphoribosyltransferase domain-containing protein [Paenibacillus alvei]MCY9707723.1 nicotinamide phosphoribosyltransferase domain-containing protein [Paenibacillus alvei]MCY9757704.1 nicotinamide phosphoribosyltransferase domain-containing protein [Paenibacillus alvei]MEC0082764.1 nicotinamide phosph
MLKDLRSNPIMLTDAYNLSHQRLKINTDWEVSHMYNRSKPMLLFGLLEIANNILKTQITIEMIDQAEAQANRMGLIFPRELWVRVVNECDGWIPIEIQTLPEGTWCPVGTPFAQIRNTIRGFGELVTWFEGEWMHGYFPSTAATQAYRMRKYLEQKQRQYGYDDSFMLRLHSFGFRGHRSLEDAYWAGISWNLFLYGTDDFHTAVHTPSAKIVSIAALAHKVTQQFDNEYEGYKHAIKATADAGEKVVAIVIDTYDAHRFLNEYLIPLAKYAAELGVHIVIRPDSGDTWEQVVIAYRFISRHYLPITNVSAIIGEGMDFENVKKADAYFEQHGVPLNFVSYGVGGGFYNYSNRDLLGWAMKTAFSNGKSRMKFSENPIKRSIPDVVGLYRNSYGDLIVGKEDDVPESANLYRTIYSYTDGMDVPFMIEYGDSEWKETQERALAANTEQANIYLSDEIRAEIGEFQRRYRNRV